MSDRELFEQALKALETNIQAWKHLADSGDAGFWEAEEQPFYETSVKAITALRAALVEDARLAEPVQQGCDHCNQPLYAAVKCRVCGRVTSAEPVQESAICDECGKSKHDGWALYCVKCVEPMFAPPQRKPLTREEAIALWADKSDGPSNGEIVSFARAIERAHGIKE